MDKLEIKITADGSHTLYVPNLDETYHSVHGAIQEALHVYINAGLNYLDNKEKLKVLEVGFGTGLNTFLTLRASTNKTIKVDYTSIEAFPLEWEKVNELNYLKKLNANTNETNLFELLHKIEWESFFKITPLFSLQKLNVRLEEFNEKEQFDVIYFDAFGPRVQPELWGVDVLKVMYEALVEGGVLVTYCAKGSVKRALKEVGFKIENIPGPPGKREMTRAIKLGVES